MHARTKLTPLTAKEQEFAAENHYMVDDFLQYYRLARSEWYDVVIFRYLLTVKKWYQRPELQKYPFVSLARRAMSSAVCNERKKQSSRIQTVSLDGIVPGTEDLRLIDTITDDNLKFVLYMEGEDMNISYDVIIPEGRRKVTGQKSDEVIALESFLTTKKMENMRIEYDTQEEAKKKLATINTYKRKNNLQDTVDIFRIEKNIYVVRKKKEIKNGKH